MRDAAQGNNGAELFHFSDGRREKIATGSYLFRCWLVLWRNTAHCISDPAVDEFQPIARVRAVITARKAKLAERFIEQHAGIIACERPTGAIGSLESRREANDQHTCIDGSE